MPIPSANDGVFVGIGEVLFDVFENGMESLGGAPLNVAFHAHQLATALGIGQGITVSCVGADIRGERVRDTLRQNGISTRYLETDPDRPTGRVSVFMNGGEPEYQIEADAAWDYIRPNATLDEVAGRCDAVCFGSLAQRAPVSRATIRRFVEQARGAVRLYDANLRRNTVSGEEGYSAEIIDSSCRLATIIKANRAELFTMCRLLGLPFRDDRRAMETLLARFSVEAVVLTAGANGTILLTSGGETRVGAAPIPADQLFPVGAGDACSAGILVGLTLGWEPGRAVELGNRMGTWVASQQSATPALDHSIPQFVREHANLPVHFERS